MEGKGGGQKGEGKQRRKGAVGEVERKMEMKIRKEGKIKE
jgi:hypothetical protein